MEVFTVEAVVGQDGSVMMPVVPFAPGTKVVVTVEEAEPMDREGFEAALRQHYAQAPKATEPGREGA
ncbi:hypothetical protein EON82_10975 [bacterium]|nr:MAG: hypothetical protein EON82_10975 [bacterium]